MSKSSKNYLGKMEIVVLESPWTVFFKNDKQYQALNIKGSRAVCLMEGNKKSIHFNCEATYPGDGVVIHELVHVYSKELMGHDLDMSADNREEFFCTLFETRGEDILRKAKPIAKKLFKYAKAIKKTSTTEEDND